MTELGGLAGMKVAVATSALEKVSGGGPSSRIPLLIDGLRKIGVDAFVPDLGHELPSLIHWLNVWPIEVALRKLSRSEVAGVPVVLSPIFLNLSGAALWKSHVPSLATNHQRGLNDQILLELGDQIRAQQANLTEPFGNYLDQLRKVALKANHFIFLSEKERENFLGIGVSSDTPYSIVRNAANILDSSTVAEDFVKEKLGLDRFVVHVGRIEPRKNQLVLAEACRRLEVPIIFIGGVGDRRYFEKVVETAGPYGIFLQRMAHDEPLLISAMRDASAFCLPSWAEGAPLAALEAGALGTPLILSDRSGEIEYFGKFAKYVDPGDIAQLMGEIAAAVQHSESSTGREERATFVRANYSWAEHINHTSRVYESALEATTSPKAHVESLAGRSSNRLFFDLTDFIYSSTPVGTARVQEILFPLVRKLWPGSRVVPVCWVRDSEYFVVLDDLDMSNASTRQEIRESFENSWGLRGDEFEPGDFFFSSSGAWTGNSGHLAAMKNLRESSELITAVLIHDLCRLTHRHLYPEAVVEQFDQGLTEITEFADAVLTYSEETKRTVFERLTPDALFSPRLSQVALGDPEVFELTEQVAPFDFLSAGLESQNSFIMFVASLEPRKNHVMILEAYKIALRTLQDRAPELIFVGKDHLAAREVRTWLLNNPIVASRVRLLSSASDGELSWLYSNCLFTVYPSLAEGWGLPIAESFAYGKACLHSDTSSMPEVSRGFGIGLDPTDPLLWAEKIIALCSDSRDLQTLERRIKTKWRPRTWESAARRLVKEIETVTARPQVPVEDRLNKVFTPVNISDRNAFVDFLGEGFHQLEETGVWQSDNSSTIRVPATLASRKRSYSLLHLTLSSLTEGGRSKRTVTLRQGDEVLARIRVGQKPKSFKVKINTSALLPAANWNVKMEIGTLASPAFLGIGKDERQLGIRVHRIGFFQA